MLSVPAITLTVLTAGALVVLVAGEADRHPAGRFEIRYEHLGIFYSTPWVWRLVDRRTHHIVRSGAHRTWIGCWLTSRWHQTRLERAADRTHRKASR